MQSRTSVIALAALSAVLGGLLLWQRSANRANAGALEERVAALGRQLAEVKGRAVAPPAAVLPAPQSNQSAISARAVGADLARQKDSQLAKVQEELAAARSRISELETNVLSLQSERATLSQARQQELKSAEETCRAGAADLQAALSNSQAELKTAQQKAALFEQENSNLRKAQIEAARQPARQPAAAGELDEISRRREGYLKNLVRRYREIDNEYRAIISASSAQRDASSPHVNDAALLRIQTVLSQAEDDLRQLDALNAKSLLVEKKRAAQ